MRILPIVKITIFFVNAISTSMKYSKISRMQNLDTIHMAPYGRIYLCNFSCFYAVYKVHSTDKNGHVYLPIVRPATGHISTSRKSISCRLLFVLLSRNMWPAISCKLYVASRCSFWCRATDLFWYRRPGFRIDFGLVPLEFRFFGS